MHGNGNTRSNNVSEKDQSIRSVGVVSLQKLAKDAIIRHRRLLADIGDTPLDLLEPVLASCTPEELQKIEDCTATGVAKRSDLRRDTWPLWYNFLQHKVRLVKRSREILKGFKATTNVNKESIWRHRINGKIPPADYHSMYEELVQQQRAAMNSTGAKMREMWTSHDKQKQTRTVQVIDPDKAIQLRTCRGSKRLPLSTSSRSTESACSSLSRKLGIKPISNQTSIKREQNRVIRKIRAPRKRLPTASQLKSHSSAPQSRSGQQRLQQSSKLTSSATLPQKAKLIDGDAHL
eukprot:jgi/Picsp_1/3880/NSC_01392-R1_elongin- f-box protein pof4